MGLNRPIIFGSVMTQVASWPLILETPAHFQARSCRICAVQLIILVINIVIRQNVFPLLQFRRKMKKRVLACNWHFTSDRCSSLTGKNCTFWFWQFSYCSGYLPYNELQDVGSSI
jgi:predicted membrane-bound dolichyl-phosphate-mannose-protein mannosyltransferase